MADVGRDPGTRPRQKVVPSAFVREQILEIADHPKQWVGPGAVAVLFDTVDQELGGEDPRFGRVAGPGELLERPAMAAGQEIVGDLVELAEAVGLVQLEGTEEEKFIEEAFFAALQAYGENMLASGEISPEQQQQLGGAMQQMEGGMAAAPVEAAPLAPGGMPPGNSTGMNGTPAAPSRDILG